MGIVFVECTTKQVTILLGQRKYFSLINQPLNFEKCKMKENENKTPVNRQKHFHSLNGVCTSFFFARTTGQCTSNPNEISLQCDGKQVTNFWSLGLGLGDTMDLTEHCILQLLFSMALYEPCHIWISPRCAALSSPCMIKSIVHYLPWPYQISFLPALSSFLVINLLVQYLPCVFHGDFFCYPTFSSRFWINSLLPYFILFVRKNFLLSRYARPCVKTWFTCTLRFKMVNYLLANVHEMDLGRKGQITQK